MKDRSKGSKKVTGVTGEEPLALAKVVKQLAELGSTYRAGRRQSREAVRGTLILAFTLTRRFQSGSGLENEKWRTRLVTALGLEGQDLSDPTVVAEIVPLAVVKAVTKPKSRSQTKGASERARAVREVLAQDLSEPKAIKLLGDASVRQLASAFAERLRSSPAGDSKPARELVSISVALSAKRRDRLMDRLKRHGRLRVELRLEDGQQIQIAKMLKTGETARPKSAASLDEYLEI